jgi:hypothetical protein
MATKKKVCWKAKLAPSSITSAMLPYQPHPPLHCRHTPPCMQAVFCVPLVCHTPQPCNLRCPHPPAKYFGASQSTTRAPGYQWTTTTSESDVGCSCSLIVCWVWSMTAHVIVWGCWWGVGSLCTQPQQPQVSQGWQMVQLGQHSERRGLVVQAALWRWGSHTREGDQMV